MYRASKSTDSSKLGSGVDTSHTFQRETSGDLAEYDSACQLHSVDHNPKGEPMIRLTTLQYNTIERFGHHLVAMNTFFDFSVLKIRVSASKKLLFVYIRRCL